MKRLLVLSIVFCVIACKQKIRTEKEVAQDSTETQSSMKGYAEESSDPFDPDGYYYSNDSLRYKQFEFNIKDPIIEIGIIGYNPKTHKYKPLPKDSVVIALNCFDTIARKVIRLTTHDFLITKDSLKLIFRTKELGDIKIYGHFGVPNYDSVEALKIIVLNAKMQFKDTTLPVNLTWWEGD